MARNLTRREARRDQVPLLERLKPGTSEDLAAGQIVIVSARWILVTAGLIFALWNPGPLNELRIEIVVILVLAVANFYLHAQLLIRRPTVDNIAYLASAGDIAVITLLIVSQGGFKSDLYIFYFPALLALSVAFPRFMTLMYTLAAVGLYFLIAIASAPLDGLQVIVARLVMLAGVAVCGTMYWGLERDRREASAEAQRSLMEQLGEREQATRPVT